MKVIFIAGAGRSGSTLLDIILGELDNCFSVGELREIFKNFFIKHGFCNCGNQYKDCIFWPEVLQKVFQKKFLTEAEIQEFYNLKKILEHLPIINYRAQSSYLQKFSTEINKFRNIWLKLYEAIFETSKAEIIIDSSKRPQFLWLLKDFPYEIYVIHLIRDPRGVAYSWSQKKFNPLTGKSMKTHHVFTSARIWVIQNIQIEILKKFINHYYFLKYEDFCKSPLENLKNMFKHFNIENKNLERIFDNNSTIISKKKHLVAGNPMRFLIGSTIEISLDERWKLKMKSIDKLIVSLITFPLLIKYGYLK